MATLLAGNEALQQRRQRMTPQARISSMFDSSRMQGAPRQLIPPSPGFRLSQVALPPQAAPQAENAIAAAFANLQQQQQQAVPQHEGPPVTSAPLPNGQTWQLSTPEGARPIYLPSGFTIADAIASEAQREAAASPTYVEGWYRHRSSNPDGTVSDRWVAPSLAHLGFV